MKGHERHPAESRCRAKIEDAEKRQEQARSAAERLSGAMRLELERALDALRGRRNRAFARLEAIHQASDETWRFACAQAEQAIDDFRRELTAVEKQLCLQAA